MSLYSEGQSPQTTAMSKEKCQRDLNVLKCNDSDEKITNSLPLYMLSTVGILYLYCIYTYNIFVAYLCVLIAIYVVPPQKKKKTVRLEKKKKGGGGKRKWEKLNLD